VLRQGNRTTDGPRNLKRAATRKQVPVCPRNLKRAVCLCSQTKHYVCALSVCVAVCVMFRTRNSVSAQKHFRFVYVLSYLFVCPETFQNCVCAQLSVYVPRNMCMCPETCACVCAQKHVLSYLFGHGIVYVPRNISELCMCSQK
jgi:hypothetical protein